MTFSWPTISANVMMRPRHEFRMSDEGTSDRLPLLELHNSNGGNGGNYANRAQKENVCGLDARRDRRNHWAEPPKS
jgi:hypothetical protein